MSLLTAKAGEDQNRAPARRAEAVSRKEIGLRVGLYMAESARLSCGAVRPRAAVYARPEVGGWDQGLAVDGELGAAVLLPALLVRLGAELLLLAKADDAQTVGWDASVDEGSTGSIGAVFAKGQVVLCRSALVGVSTDDDLEGRVSDEEGSGSRGCGDGVRAQLVTVEVEEGVLDVLLEELLARHVGLSRRRSWGYRDANGYTNVGFRRAAIALGGEMEVGGA